MSSKGYNSSVSNASDPTFLDYYRVVNKIGSGGFGSCLKVVDKGTGHFFAAKIQESDCGRHEYEIHRLLSNEHVAQVVCFFDDHAEHAGQSCMVMQLYHSDLGQLLNSRPKGITLHEAQDYTQQLVSGLKYVHGQRIVHRDLKPANLLLDENNILKIADFGLAMHVPCRCEVSGTRQYMAPEVLKRKRCSYAADIWAVGVILYEMVFGYRPFEGTKEEIENSILCNEYAIPSASAPVYVENLIRNLLDENSINRPKLDDILKSDFLFRAAETIQAVASIVDPAEEMVAPAAETVLLVVPPAGIVDPAAETVLLVVPPAGVDAPMEWMVAPVAETVPLVVPAALEAPAENIVAPMLEKVVPLKKRCFKRRKRSYLWPRKKILVHRWFRCEGGGSDIDGSARPGRGQ